MHKSKFEINFFLDYEFILPKQRLGNSEKNNYL